jgi:hypothetical protein
VYDVDASQQEIFELTAKPIVDSVLHGFNGIPLLAV